MMNSLWSVIWNPDEYPQFFDRKSVELLFAIRLVIVHQGLFWLYIDSSHQQYSPCNQVIISFGQSNLISVWVAHIFAEKDQHVKI